MLVYNSIQEFCGSLNSKPVALTIGNFDGLHQGHISLIQNLAQEARVKNLPTVLLTFHQHTKKILDSDKSFTTLQSSQDKTKKLAQSGLIDHLILEDFNLLKDILAQDFIANILVSKLNIKLIIVGQNHRFGKDRVGSYELLKQNANILNFEVLEADLYKEQGRVISSTLLREQLKKQN